MSTPNPSTTNANLHNKVTTSPIPPPPPQKVHPPTAKPVSPERTGGGESSSPASQSSTDPSHLIPRSALDRKFRATSFAAKLNPQQRTTLSLWLIDEKLTIDAIRKKVAAPSPEGFGLEVHPTTLCRLQRMLKNYDVSEWFSESMDTACDLLDNPETAQTASLREALTVMLYSRAVYAAKNQADPSAIDKLVTTINKLETRQPAPRRESREKTPLTTRHQVELSIVPATGAPESTPKIINITATALPAHEKS
jgi:hypothetical protein